MDHGGQSGHFCLAESGHFYLASILRLRIMYIMSNTHLERSGAWTPGTLAAIASGNFGRREFVALNCALSHGAHGRSTSGDVPTIPGLDAAAIY